MFDREGIQDQFFGGRDVYTGISLTAAPGVTPGAAAPTPHKVLPAGVDGRAG